MKVEPSLQDPVPFQDVCLKLDPDTVLTWVPSPQQDFIRLKGDEDFDLLLDGRPGIEEAYWVDRRPNFGPNAVQRELEGGYTFVCGQQDVGNFFSCGAKLKYKGATILFSRPPTSDAIALDAVARAEALLLKIPVEQR